MPYAFWRHFLVWTLFGKSYIYSVQPLDGFFHVQPTLTSMNILSYTLNTWTLKINIQWINYESTTTDSIDANLLIFYCCLDSHEPITYGSTNDSFDWICRHTVHRWSHSRRCDGINVIAAESPEWNSSRNTNIDMGALRCVSYCDGSMFLWLKNSYHTAKQKMNKSPVWKWQACGWIILAYRITCVWFFSGMRSTMLSKGTIRWEWFIAQVTTKRFLARMRPNVNTKQWNVDLRMKLRKWKLLSTYFRRDEP